MSSTQGANHKANQEGSFTATYDSLAKGVTAVVFILLVVIAATTKNMLAGGLAAAICVAAYAWSPAGYSISDGYVVVRRLIGNARIAIGGIRAVRPATADDFRGCIRLFGSGGLFGYYGIYRTSKLGKCTWYVTDRSRAVVLVSDSGTAVLSPGDVAGFIAAIPGSTMRTPASAKTGPGPAMFGSVETAPAESAAGWLKAVILLVIAGVVGWNLLYAPGPPAYTLTPGSLTIQDRFYPITLNAASVDVAKIRVIDFSKDAEWEPVERTNGFGNAHYHSGQFRVSSGKVVRMYRADSSRLVLLPPKDNGTAVLLETREPDKFVAEVRQEWAGGS